MTYLQLILGRKFQFVTGVQSFVLVKMCPISFEICQLAILQQKSLRTLTLNVSPFNHFQRKSYQIFSFRLSVQMNYLIHVAQLLVTIYQKARSFSCQITISNEQMIFACQIVWTIFYFYGRMRTKNFFARNVKIRMSYFHTES